MNVKLGLIKRFRQLRWQLTLTYTAVTVSALLVLELIGILIASPALLNLMDRNILPPQIIEAARIDYVPTLRHYLEQEPPDREGITIWLERFESSSNILQGTDEIPVVLYPGQFEMSLIDEAGILLGVSASGSNESFLVGESLDNSKLAPEMTDLVRAALVGEKNPSELFAHNDGSGELYMSVPIYDLPQMHLLGLLLIETTVPTVSAVLGRELDVIAISLVIFTFFGGLIGAFFGWLAARRLVKRLSRIGEATRAWSQGDFGILVNDPFRDELGELAYRLNRMAQQLERTLESRRELAILEERNRLARDLHDSAKQQAFAAAGQINAARMLITGNPAEAGNHIEEAEKLIRNLRRELGDLIRQLRPAELEGKGLAAALGEYAADWSRQTGISQDVLVRRDRPLPLEIEQAIFRIMQEALANSARHSHASTVKIQIACSDVDVTCSLIDDGVGFDPEQEIAGFGLRSMRERAVSIGGTLRLESAPGSGTTTIITIPTSFNGLDDEEKYND